jgi:hypothetical protein
VSGCSAANIAELFERPQRTLVGASYSAMPFWHFFHTRLAEDGIPAIRDLLREYKSSGNIIDAFIRVLATSNSLSQFEKTLPGFFALFSSNRLNESKWQELHIADGSGNLIETKLSFRDELLPCNRGLTIQYLGSLYFRFQPLPAEISRTIRCRVSATVGNAIVEFLKVNSDESIVRLKRLEVCPVDELIALGPNEKAVAIVSGLTSDNQCRITASSQ